MKLSDDQFLEICAGLNTYCAGGPKKLLDKVRALEEELEQAEGIPPEPAKLFCREDGFLLVNSWTKLLPKDDAVALAFNKDPGQWTDHEFVMHIERFLERLLDTNTEDLAGGKPFFALSTMYKLADVAWWIKGFLRGGGSDLEPHHSRALEEAMLTIRRICDVTDTAKEATR